MNRMLQKIDRWIYRFLSRYKAPRMIWGYKNPDGALSRRTRFSDTVFWYHKENIVIEDNAFVWHYTIIDGTGGVHIEEGVQIGAWVGIFTHSSHVAIRLYGNHYQTIPEGKKKGYAVKPVRIGKYAFIGAGAKVLPGVTIGKGAVVAAGAIVSDDVPDFTLVSGNPAKVVGNVKTLDERYLRNDSELQQYYTEWSN